MKTLGTKVNDHTYQRFQELSDNTGLTVSENLRNLVETSLTAKSDHIVEQNEEILESYLKSRKESPCVNHVLNCPECQFALADKGYVLMSQETWKKVKQYV